MKFDWDAAKAAANVRKHGVSVEEASSVFFDPFAITTPDVEHSDDEDRQKTVGVSSRLRVLVVVHTQRVANVMRIIRRRNGVITDFEDVKKWGHY